MASPQSYKRPTLYSQGTEVVEIQIKQKFRLFFFFLLNRIIDCTQLKYFICSYNNDLGDTNFVTRVISVFLHLG